MQRHGFLRLLAVVTGFGLANLAAHAQTAPVQGKLVSASTQTSAQSKVTIYTTPSSGHFVLTQFCAGASASLSGKTFGSIASTGPGLSTNLPLPCISFNPGFPLPTHEKIECTTGGSSFCSIVGVIEP
jgi:hypothetical protein